MRVYWKLLAWTMLLIIAQDIIIFTRFYMMIHLVSHEEYLLYLLYSQLFGVIAALINPILFIAVLYLIGRNLDIKGDLSTILLSLFIGCLVGLIVGDVIYLAYGLMLGQFGIDSPLLLLVISLIINLITHFFVGFGALAMGFLTAKKTED